MIIISNRQRDDMVRYIDILCERLSRRGTRDANTRRLALRLRKTLADKQPLTGEQLNCIKDLSRAGK